MDSARSANVSSDDFAHDMRRLMKLPEGQKITKKLPREHMTMSQYNTARAHYGEALRRILEEDVPDDGSPSTHDQPDAPTAASKAGNEPSATEAGLDAMTAEETWLSLVGHHRWPGDNGQLATIGLFVDMLGEKLAYLWQKLTHEQWQTCQQFIRGKMEALIAAFDGRGSWTK